MHVCNYVMYASNYVMFQVCGSDGISYVNECKLQAENCEKKTSVTVRQQGLCNLCKNYANLLCN